MKTAFIPIAVAAALCAAFTGTALAQVRPDAAVIERGPHHARWAWTTEEVWPDGQKKTVEHSVIETATGLNYLKDGLFTPSKEEIEIFQDGAIARQGQHSVIWTPNLNTEGAVDLLMPDGKQRLRSHVLGLAYTEATGKSALIAEPKDCFGEVLGNQVIYRDALNGPFKADVRYTYTRAGFEQDIIIREIPPSPADYQMDPAVTRLEVWTEFLDPPVPTVRSQVLRQETDPLVRRLMAMPDLIDQTLDFDSMQIGSGQVFPLDGEGGAAVPTAKSWVKTDGRQFLVEAVEYPTVAPLLQGLQQAAAPAKQGNAKLKPPVNGRLQLARAFSKLPARDRAREKPMQMASAPLTGKALVWDYTTLNSSQTNQIFAADVTYQISAAVNLYGSNNVLEGGTVLKFNQNAGASLVVKGVLKSDTDLYRPAVLTAEKDNTIGETVTSGTPSGGYASTALDFDYATSGAAASLTNIRVLYAVTAIRFNGGTGHELRHVQLVNCGTAVKADTANYALRNVLGWNLTNALTGSGTSTGAWEHATFDGVTNLVTTVTGRFTNCLLTAVVSTNGLTGAGNVVLSSSSGVFKTVGNGSHYLADGSYRDLGTTNISPALASELKLRTTYAPIALGNIAADTTLTPQAGRDTINPDLGWHYAPLDYWASGVTVSSNVTVLASNGVAVGLDLATNSWAFILKNARLISTGDALKFNRLVRAHTAQEKSGGNQGTRACIYDGNSSTGSRECALRWRFTEFTQLANDGYLLYVGTKFGALEWTHSRVYNPSLVLDMSGSGTLVCGLTNTLWERGGVQIGTITTGSSVTAHLRNNLARNVSWHFVAGTTNWTVRDNLFDSMAFLGDHGWPVQNCTNAYFNTTYGLSGGVSNISLGSLTYQTNALGRYYQPTNSALTNAGSRTADLAGLYQFTTSTNQVKETNSFVDIGLHYMAVDANGNPIDSDGDGIPDYIEDGNGNGVLDSGETKPNDAADWGLKVFITRPRNGSNLP